MVPDIRAEASRKPLKSSVHLRGAGISQADVRYFFETPRRGELRDVIYSRDFESDPFGELSTIRMLSPVRVEMPLEFRLYQLPLARILGGYSYAIPYFGDMVDALELPDPSQEEDAETHGEKCCDIFLQTVATGLEQVVTNSSTRSSSTSSCAERTY